MKTFGQCLVLIGLITTIALFLIERMGTGFLVGGSTMVVGAALMEATTEEKMYDTTIQLFRQRCGEMSGSLKSMECRVEDMSIEERVKFLNDITLLEDDIDKLKTRATMLAFWANMQMDQHCIGENRKERDDA
jgi:hypothetical protein